MNIRQKRFGSYLDTLKLKSFLQRNATDGAHVE